ncbi:MAG TPA: hypothetical protein VGM87_09375 [Roseomonas sp.]
MRRRRKPSLAQQVFGFEPSKLQPHAPPPRTPAAAPIDLGKPIAPGDWDRLAGLRPDAAFQGALVTMRKRYELSADPMLAARTVAEVMVRKRVDICEAIMLIARDREHDAY